MPWDQN